MPRTCRARRRFFDTTIIDPQGISCTRIEYARIRNDNMLFAECIGRRRAMGSRGRTRKSFGIGRCPVTAAMQRNVTRRDATRLVVDRASQPTRPARPAIVPGGKLEERRGRIVSRDLPTFRTWLLRKLSSSSAVAVKSCFAIASILLRDVGVDRKEETSCCCCSWREREGARYTLFAPYEMQNGARCVHGAKEYTGRNRGTDRGGESTKR